MKISIKHQYKKQIAKWGKEIVSNLSSNWIAPLNKQWHECAWFDLQQTARGSKRFWSSNVTSIFARNKRDIAKMQNASDNPPNHRYKTWRSTTCKMKVSASNRNTKPSKVNIKQFYPSASKASFKWAKSRPSSSRASSRLAIRKVPSPRSRA